MSPTPEPSSANKRKRDTTVNPANATNTPNTSAQRKRRKLNYGSAKSTRAPQISTPQTVQRAPLAPVQHHQQLRHLLNTILMLSRLHATTANFARLDHFTDAIMQGQSHNRDVYATMGLLLRDLQILELWDVLNFVQLEDVKREMDRMRVVRVDVMRRNLPKLQEDDVAKEGSVTMPTEEELKETVLYRVMNDPIQNQEATPAKNGTTNASTTPATNGASEKTTDNDTSPQTPPASPTTPVSKGTPLHSPYRNIDPLAAVNKHNFRLFQYYKELEDICLHVLLAFQSISRSGSQMATRLPLVDLLNQIAALHENRPTKQKLLKHVLHLANEAPAFLSLYHRSVGGGSSQVLKCSLKEEASMSSLLQRPLTDMHIVVEDEVQQNSNEEAKEHVVSTGDIKEEQAVTNKEDKNGNAEANGQSANGDTKVEQTDDSVAAENHTTSTNGNTPQTTESTPIAAEPLVLRPHDLVVEVTPKQFQSTQGMLRKKKEEHRVKSHLV